ncbi:unnamed protein product [Nesidiocoris tenuis]|uniref:Uncharacterized protein n=1 Tax=Nesidiocoris tenuis TaxID=355587 RepID=A0A6H5HWG3_9HEMI|nr:unnamed protein product [Nesidiocoris tenuis]
MSTQIAGNISLKNGKSFSGKSRQDPPRARRFDSTSQPKDFIQELFLEKIREYAKLKKENGDKIFDPVPELEAERQKAYEVLAKSFFKTSEPPNPTTFPNLEFKEQQLESVDLEELPNKTDAKKTSHSEDARSAAQRRQVCSDRSQSCGDHQIRPALRCCYVREFFLPRVVSRFRTSFQRYPNRSKHVR